MSTHGDQILATLEEDEEPEAGLEPSSSFVEDDRPPHLSGAVRLGAPSAAATRHSLVNWLLVITTAFTIGAAVLVLVVPADAWTRLQSQIGFLLTPFHTLLAGAIGYYFADRKREDD